MKLKLLLSGITFSVALLAGAQTYPYQDTRLSPLERARDLCSRLSLEEKASLMQDVSPAIPRLGIPPFQWWSEALHGVGRNGYATVYPATIGMAASFDDALLQDVFTSVSDEARAKNTLARHTNSLKRYAGLSFWTPNINIFRDPRWGRGQETYGEDPYLTTRMGLAVVRGLQGPVNGPYKKLLACAKHFAVHSGPEWNRHTFNLENVPMRDLWETYLPAFKALVQTGHVAEVMCAYQRLDGEPCCGNTRLLQQILRNEWGFKGLVTSDCSAITDFWKPGHHEVTKNAHEASAMAVRSGTDLECGSNYRTLPEAVKAGEITEATIDTSVVRLLQARIELGDLDPDSLNPWTKIPMSVVACKEHKEQALRMAREGVVLLQNKNNVLPLPKNAADIVVMGPNATDSAMQWGNYNGYPTRTVTLLQAVRQKLGGNVRYVRGCGLTSADVSESLYDKMHTPDGAKGMKATYWNNMKMQGTPAATQVLSQPFNLSNGGATVFAPGVNLEGFSARYEGTFVPENTEKVVLSLAFDDGARLIVNGDTLADVWKGRARIQHINAPLNVQKGKSYQVVIEYFQDKDFGLMQFDVARQYTPTTQQLLEEVGDAGTVVFAGGISPSLEGEEMKVDAAGFKGGDRTNIELPQVQRDLIAALHKAGKRVVYVNFSGSAIALMPETQNADAIVQAWYPGEQGGTAVADVLFGDYNPTGKLPITFYRSTADLPDFLDYRMTNRTYRYFTGQPLYPFGYGLSYTTFSIDNPVVKRDELKVRVSNTGRRDGTEVVQLYIRRVADVNGPLRSLRGYQRVSLKAGESKVVTFSLRDKSLLTTWDAGSNTMRYVPGKYELMVGTSSADADLRKVTYVGK